MNSKLKIIFAGTPEFAANHLQALIDSAHQVVAVYSQPDRPAGRGNKLQASAVKQLALEHNIPVLQPVSLKESKAQIELAALDADIMVVVAYGLILPLAVLNTPRLGCINVHGSLLPKWRGAAPIQRSIWAGDAATGVTIMQMDEGLDTGPMLLERSIPIETNDTSASLYSKLADIGPQALMEYLGNIQSLGPRKQDNALASYAKKLSKEEACINWHYSAMQLERNVRAFNPWPVSYFELQSITIKVWRSEVVVNSTYKNSLPGQILQADKQGILVKTAQDCLLLQNIQLPGKKPMNSADVLNGRSDLFVVGSIIPSSSFNE
ncbi:methionyl-tRNA formyltransferase [Paraglaciecola hydrolytica]|uniref:Methionyl-tRNA formyltransferase n=1 Tax=Paraglaciecola hydrolytica TaxID=1799789 RepID=A0A136A451_9ALTE|nr:methionyl-tRNA formyltransferase [Paraglaciecola hydrolytica]KXI30013.1 methionyl-tRNA formyltransferase [Paraglaciecola hydrolytica]